MEYIPIIFASISFLYFFRHTAIPWFVHRLQCAATSTSSALRGDFLFLSSKQTTIGLLLLCLLPGTIVAITFRNEWIGCLVGCTCALLSGAILRVYRNRRRKMITVQLPGMLDILAGHLQAGHSLAEALKNSVPILPRGIREEVSWLFQMVRIGTPLSEALTLWESRFPIEEMLLVVRPLKCALSTGSDVANLLSRCRDILQAKQMMERRLKSMTAQARLQAVVLTLLPPGFILVLSNIDPGYLHRCIGTVPGIVLLALAAMLQIGGWLLIRMIMTGKP